MSHQDAELEDFIRTYEIAFNERLTHDEAIDMLTRLTDLYRRIRRVSAEVDAQREDEGCADSSSAAEG